MEVKWVIPSHQCLQGVVKVEDGKTSICGYKGGVGGVTPPIRPLGGEEFTASEPKVRHHSRKFVIG